MAPAYENIFRVIHTDSLLLPTASVTLGGRHHASLVDRGEGMQFSRHLVDRRVLHVVGGFGGAGALSYKKHTKHTMVGPGWPCGGSGGKGGDVLVKASDVHFSLAHLKGHVQAPSGQSGKRGNLNGDTGRDSFITVPRGVMVREMVPQDGEQADQAPLVPGQLLADLDKPGETVVVALGGRGGMGNNMARPHEATLGLPGEIRKIELELKMVADVGLVGMPNAGKSALLGSVSRACPKIAPYPFTTVAPYVGKVHFLDGSSMTIADVPGLVEGAHAGEGLGHEFLRHLERTKVLLYVVDCARSSDPFSDFLSLQREVEAFSRSMSFKPCAVIATKCDVDPEQTLPKVDHLFRLVRESEVFGQNSPIFVRAISARFGEGVKGLLQELRVILQGDHERWLAKAAEMLPADDMLSPASG